MPASISAGSTRDPRLRIAVVLIAEARDGNVPLIDTTASVEAAGPVGEDVAVDPIEADIVQTATRLAILVMIVVVHFNENIVNIDHVSWSHEYNKTKSINISIYWIASNTPTLVIIIFVRIE